MAKETAVIAYVDLANVFNWRKTLKWQIRIEDMIRSIWAFPTVKEIKVYYGTNNREPEKSKALHNRIRKAGAILRTKPVKYIRKTIDESFFVRQSTLKSFTPEATTLVQSIVSAVQSSGSVIEERKCNFDVEMAMEMLDDMDRVSAVLLFSGDSDFFAPLERLKIKNRRIYVVGVRGQVAKELFDIKDAFIDFGKLYIGRRTPIESENPAFGGTA